MSDLFSILYIPYLPCELGLLGLRYERGRGSKFSPPWRMIQTCVRLHGNRYIRRTRRPGAHIHVHVI